MASQSLSFRPATVIKQIPWSVDKKAAVSLLIILTVFSLVGWLYLGQASVITSSTLQIEQMQYDLKLINQKNAELSLEIAKLESLSRIEERARALGFQPTNPATIRYLHVNDYPAMTETPNTIMLQPAPEESIWQTWVDHLAAWAAGKPMPQ